MPQSSRTISTDAASCFQYAVPSALPAGTRKAPIKAIMPMTLCKCRSPSPAAKQNWKFEPCIPLPQGERGSRTLHKRLVTILRSFCPMPSAIFPSPVEGPVATACRRTQVSGLKTCAATGEGSPRQLLHQRVGEFVIAVDMLHVVMVVENLEEFDERFAGFIADGDIVLRAPDDRGRLRASE